MKNEARARINTSTQGALLLKGNEEKHYKKKDIGKHEVFMYPLADARVLNTRIISLHIIVLSFNLNS